MYKYVKHSDKIIKGSEFSAVYRSSAYISWLRTSVRFNINASNKGASLAKLMPPLPRKGLMIGFRMVKNES